MPPLPSLTAAEAADRSRLLAVERYDLDVDVTGLPTGPDFRTTATIAFGCREPGAATFVDCAAEVVRAELNGAELPASAVTPGRIALAGLGETNVLVVESVQRDTGSRTGVHRSVDPAEGEVYVWTTFEPDDARRAWACFDQPDLKAPHALTVTAPATWTVLSSSGDPQVDDLGDDRRRWTFATTPPLSTYVPALVAGPYAGLHSDRDGYRLGLWCRRSLLPFLERDAEELFDLTARGLAFLGERFAMPFPQPTYDQVFVPEMGGAMENYGCVTWTDGYVFRSPPTAADRELRGLVLLHEMAHMWFGDVVTMRWWDDLWLNEAFAEWAAHWAAGETGAFPDAWAGFLAGRKLTGYAADRAPTSHPIRQPAPDVVTASTGFDAITYAKGASVLKQLAAAVGEDAFVAALRAHFAAHAWGSATLADLVAAVEAASGRDLGRWTREWLDAPRTDTVRSGRRPGGAGLEAVGYDDVQPREHRLDVTTYARRGDGLELRQRVPVSTSGGFTALPELDASADLVVVNDDDLDFVSWRPEGEDREALLELGHLLPAAVSRAVAVATAWELLVLARVTPAAFVGLTTRTLRRETAESVVEPFLGLALRAATLWAPGDERDDLRTEVADVALALADAGVSRAGALRALARAATTEPQLEALADRARDDVDLGWHRLVRLAALGRLADGEVAALQARDPDPDAWVRALTVRAAEPSAAAKDEAWDAVVTGARVPLADVREVAAAFWEPGQDELLRPYAERYLEVLPSLGGGGMLQTLAVAGRMFPLFGVDGDFVGRADELGATTSDPLLRRILLERTHELRSMLDVRGGTRVVSG